MRKLLSLSLIVLTFSCIRMDQEPVPDAPVEYPDWYTITSPIDKPIQSIWGDWDNTLIISTMYELFRSTDQGKTWQQVHSQSTGIFGVVALQDTLFTMNGLRNIQEMNGNAYSDLVNAEQYSVDEGLTWQRYGKRNAVFESLHTSSPRIRFKINPVTTSNDTTYTINRVFRDGPTATTGPFETPGVITSGGRRIDLPRLHQLNSLYLDSKERLYVAGSDAVCGRGFDFSFCNSKGGRGVVYISKRPLP
ncbi:hypothetical protein [Telluribacter sp. SYSU D00476]|uniref:hypothetical protein n=1 Tax=Telluribacter sp. SYSU D00476 TaxID=2811430 RepID=UPI001FF1E987|nr:hypothetical protein [Telluribacter sp. SYSU D00476]